MSESRRTGPLRSQRIRRAGVTAWSALGIVVLIVVVAAAIGALSGILVPLVVAAILGIVLEPWVSWLERRRVPSALAAVIGLVSAVLVAAAMVWLVVVGFIQQLPAITQQVMTGWNAFVSWARGLDLDAVLLDQIREAAYGYAPRLGEGILGLVISTLSGGVSMVIGTFFSLFFLFFVLKDFRRFGEWLSRVTGTDPVLVERIKDLSQTAVQGYFRGTALTAIITAPIFLLPLLFLKVPLILPISILYFFLSFIPYVGAWITGAFAILIAFGSAGPTGALIVGISLLVSNGTIQSAVGSWALGSSLSLHPVVVLLATIVGGTIAGMLGMVLGPPVAAAVVKSVAAVREGGSATTSSAAPSEPEPAQP
ncbi:AI-2E family transporter [Acidipropionibacterium jensenii]|uniref:AI-2E family transporter n=1 Tax=Acidipropionibacterium jensenii TaxID=1749 RepID=UPI00110B128F|nr:AI-2E family transporter [Acidipropionibacterium jensenii]QCV87222.1 AI-2E family transporter [Acidipropionibacterium jensenii]